MTPAEQLRVNRIKALKSKLQKRQGLPGFTANVEAIKKQLADLEEDVTFRDVETKVFVSVEHAIQNPETTERVEVDE